MKRYFIAGIDPGVYTGYAFLSLSGELLTYGSKFSLNVDGAIKLINDFGTPSLITTDVKKPSSYVLRIASHFSIPIFSPNKDISIKLKKYLKIKDPHARDAYASALKAYHFYENRFRSIDSKNVSNKDYIKHMIIRGKRASDFIK